MSATLTIRPGLATVLFFVMAGASWAQQSQEPRRQSAQGTETNAKAEQRGTDNAPFVIKILEPEQAQQKAEPNRSKGKKKWLDGWSLSDRIAGIAGLMAFLQFAALVATVGVMIRNGRRELRAYLLPDQMLIIDGNMLDPPVPARANVPGVVLLLKNSGQTPAYHVVSWAQIDVIETRHEGTLNPPIPLHRVHSLTLGSDCSFNKSLWYARALTPDEIAEVAAGTKGVYVYGRIEYEDAFRTKRWSNFRLRYSGAFPPLGGSFLAIARLGTIPTNRVAYTRRARARPVASIAALSSLSGCCN